MKKVIKIFVSVVALAVLFMACDSKQSLQKYYVDSESDDDFISFNIPTSVVNLKEGVSLETKETLNSLKKLNILAFKINDKNKAKYLIENKKVKEILKSKKFNELMRGKHEGVNFMIKYLGDDDEMDEVVLYASEKNKGFVVARVLGEDMKPEKIMKLLKNINDFDKESPAFSQIEDLLGGLK